MRWTGPDLIRVNPSGSRSLFRASKNIIWVGLAAALLVGGCALRRARDAKNPDKTPPGERTVTAAEAGLSSDTVLTIDRAIEIALAYHPAVAQSKQSLAVADRQYRNAIAGYLPQVQASGGYRRQTQNSSAGTGVSPPPAGNDSQDSYSASLGLNQLVFDFGKTPAAVRQAAAQKRAAEKSLRVAENDLTYQVRLAYYELSKAQALVQVTQDTERQFQIHLEQARALVEVGRRIKNDVTKGEVDLGNARLNLIGARNSVKTARAGLNQSLGLAEEPGYSIVEPALEEIDPGFEELLKAARESDPELLALKDEEQAASAAVDVAIAGLFPGLALGGGYTWSGVKLPLIWNWFIGPTLTWNLFDGFRNYHQIDIATAQLRSARARRAGREQQVYQDLSQATAQLEDAQKRLELSNLIERQAQENLDLMNELYKVGRASAVELTDAQVSLSKARSDQVQARFDYQTAVARIRHAIGGKQL